MGMICGCDEPSCPFLIKIVLTFVRKNGAPANPNSFERQCDRNATATYTLRPDGKIGVENACLRSDGGLSMARGWTRCRSALIRKAEGHLLLTLVRQLLDPKPNTADGPRAVCKHHQDFAAMGYNASRLVPVASPSRFAPASLICRCRSGFSHGRRLSPVGRKAFPAMLSPDASASRIWRGLLPPRAAACRIN